MGWRTTGELDLTAMADLLPVFTLPGRVARSTSRSCAHWMLLAGRPLTTLPGPPAAPLAIRWSLPVWCQRHGLVWRALFGFALGSATAVLIVR